MNILFVTNNLPYPPTDGWKIRVWAFIHDLAKRHRVSVASFIQPTEDPEALEGLRKHCAAVQVVTRDSQYSPWKLLQGVVSQTPFPILNYHDGRMVDVIQCMLKNGTFDIVQAEGLQMAQYCFGIAKRTVLDLHNVDSVVMARYAKQERHTLRRAYAAMTAKKMAHYERAVCGRFAECLTCSHDDARILGALTGVKNIGVVPNGVDTDRYAPNGTYIASPNRLVFIGRMDYHANIDGVRWFCDDVLPRIHAERPDVTFQIVGSHPTRHVQQLARRAGVEVTGFVEDVRPYLRAGAVVVIPLRIGGGTRLKLMEALAMGKPVVSTRIGAEGVAVTSGKDVILADGAAEFSMEVLHLLQHPEVGIWMGQAGRRLVQDHYSWRMIAADLETIYERQVHAAALQG